MPCHSAPPLSSLVLTSSPPRHRQRLEEAGLVRGKAVLKNLCEALKAKLTESIEGSAKMPMPVPRR